MRQRENKSKNKKNKKCGNEREREKKKCTVKNVSMETAKSINLVAAKSEGTKETFLMDGANGWGGF